MPSNGFSGGSLEVGVEDYFWQDGPAAEESFIPAFDGEGVEPATGIEPATH